MFARCLIRSTAHVCGSVENILTQSKSLCHKWTENHKWSYSILKPFIDKLETDSPTHELLHDFVKESFSYNSEQKSTINELCSKMIVLQREITELNECLQEFSSTEIGKLASEDISREERSLLKVFEVFVDLVHPAVGANINEATLEISAGAGGQEAMIWANDLFEMYKRVSPNLGLLFAATEFNKTDIGGARKAFAIVSGRNAYQLLKFEGGIHRVQRVPKTERMGRIHTSTAAVVVMPQPTEIEINLNGNDLHITTYRSSGPGGQHVNKTDSAVRVVHKPTGIIVTCQEERSQHKNRELALSKLRGILYENMVETHMSKERSRRRLQAGSKSRSEKIRTYNWPRRRVTDHRIVGNFPGTHDLNDVLMGGGTLLNIINALQSIDQEDRKQAVFQGFLDF